MNVQQIKELAIELGIKSDLRGSEKVYQNMNRLQKQFDKLSEDKKAKFDQEKLTNPYTDSGIHFDSGVDVSVIKAGIDIDTAELMLAKQEGDVDLVIAHHPVGKGLANLHDVMDLQAEVISQYGVPINVAQGLLKVRIDEVARGVNPINHYKSVDTAKSLNLSFMNVHTPADNLVASFLRKELEQPGFTYIGEIMEALNKIPEYQEAEKRGFGPRLFSGSEDNYCGKVAITEITGGTEGSPKIYEKMAAAGVGTIIGMHMSEEHKKAAEKCHINAIIAGHISSDSLGMNLFLDELERQGIKIKTCSGLIRVSRLISLV